jgi:RimJ/RimL family protein N-acetyltransferase
MFVFQNTAVDLSTLILTGKRVNLAPLIPSHSHDLLKEFDANITQFMVPAPINSITHAMGFIGATNQLKRQNKALILAVIHPISNLFLGCVALITRPDIDKPEIGIWIKKSAHGHYYGRDAVRTICEWASEALCFKALIYPVDKRNIASRKIAESLGGQIVREQITLKEGGGNLNEVVYEITSRALNSD